MNRIVSPNLSRKTRQKNRIFLEVNMYYLIDLYQLSRIPFESKTTLLTYWRFRLYRDHCFGEAPPLNFRDLNVTGNDVYATEFDGPWLRRFQVVDEAGRSQDIRTWTKEIKEVNAMYHFPYRRPAPAQARFRIDPVDMGSKMPLRKGRYGAFTKQRLVEACGVPKLDWEDDLLGFTPVRDNSAPKKPRNRSWKSDYSGGTRSWKDNTKNTSQWGRHIERVKEMPVRKNAADEFDIEGLVRDLVESNEEVSAPATGETAVMLISAAAGCET